MKNYIFISIILVVLTGCTSTKLVEWESDFRSFGFDFRPYTESGFMITPETYLEPYEAMGLVEIIAVPEIKKIGSGGIQARFLTDRYRKMSVGLDYYYVENGDTDKLIAELHRLAVALGADAIINFQMVGESMYNNNVEIETIKASGFAIKRL